MKLDYNKVLIFDFETTGLNYRFNNIIEIGAILLEKKDGSFQIKEEFNVFIKQNEPLPAKIVEITNITDEMLINQGIPEQEAFIKFDSLIDQDTLLVAYNLAFDIGFLGALYQKYHNINYLINNDILDAMAVYKDRYKYPHRLESALSTFNIINERAHRAIDDAKTTFLLLEQLALENNNLYKYINVLGYNPRYGAPRVKVLKQGVKFIPQGMNGFREIEKSYLK